MEKGRWKMEKAEKEREREWRARLTKAKTREGKN
jgi:hypothetical protein